VSDAQQHTFFGGTVPPDRSQLVKGWRKHARRIDRNLGLEAGEPERPLRVPSHERPGYPSAERVREVLRGSVHMTVSDPAAGIFWSGRR